MRNKLLNAFVIALILFQAFAPIGALAYTGTDQPDYQPGSTVTISGDNSDGAGYTAGETVVVEVSGPNDFAASCEATADDSAAWSCPVKLPADAADGSYTYVAAGQISGVSENGGFTVTVPAMPTEEPTLEPTQAPTVAPTSQPTEEPTQAATVAPTTQPTEEPTLAPTEAPTQAPPSELTQEAAPTASAVLLPFVTSDKADYAPAEQVTLSSGNWQPGEWVVLYVNDSIGQTWSIATNKQADANGAWTYQFNLPNWFVATYHVTATGEVSGVAITDFTDSVSSVTITSPSSSVTFTSLPATLTVSFNYATSTTGTTTGIVDLLGTTVSNSNPLSSGMGYSSSIVLTIPEGTLNGTYNVKVTVTNNDGTGANNKNDQKNGAVVINVPTNTAPTANAVTTSTNEDTAKAIILTGTDVQTCELTFSIVASPSHGTLGSITNNACVAGSPNSDNASVTYTPTANYNGSDSFTYKANDGSLDSNIATVIINAITVNDAPIAVNDGPYTTNEDTTLNVTATLGVLANDTDVDSSSLIAVLVSGPAHGNVTLNSNGSFSYTPASNYNGSDSFTYKANDSTADSNPATVSITINPGNDAPVAANDSYSTNEDTALNVLIPGVLGNDTDVDGSSLKVILVSDPSHGTLTLNADGSFIYTPTANYNGSDGFIYKTNDGSLDSNAASVTIMINAVNDAPVAVNDTYTTDEDTPLTVAAAGVLSNDIDIDSVNLTAVLVAGPSHGTLTLNADGSFSYTPAANYNGSDSLTYKTNDGSLDSNVASVTITIKAVNDAPIVAANQNSVTVNEGSPASNTGAWFDADEDYVNLSTSVGTLVKNSNGTWNWQYTPTDGPDNSQTVTITADDGHGGVSTTTFSLVVNNVAPMVTLSPMNTANEGETKNYTFTSTDPGADTFALVSESCGDNGTLSNAIFDTATGAGSFDCTFPDGPATSTVSVRVKDSDNAYSNTSSIIVAIANVAPTLTISGNADVDEGSLYTLNLSSSDPGTDTIAHWTIDWGDGSVQTVTSNPSSATHTYADGPNSYIISATATDDDSTFNANTRNTQVNNVVPSIAISGASNVNEGSPYSLILGDVTDPGTDIVSSYIVHWGDGSSDTYSNSGTKSHNYADGPNSYKVTVDLVDEDGMFTDRATALSITVNNIKPTPQIDSLIGNSGAACVAGNIVKLDFSFTDPGVNDATWSVDIDWGDGSTHTTYSTAMQGTQPQQPHSYGVGSFQITVKVTDKDNAQGSASSASSAVSHLYNMTGILAPFNSDGTSVWKYGSTLPVKVQITDCKGTPVSGLAPKIGTSLVSSSDPTISIDETGSTSAADTTGVMRYDPTAGQYIYNFASKNLSDPTAVYYMTVKGTDTSGKMVTSPAMVQIKFGLKSK
ncbi:MAG: Ig-like domain-containing protein [Bacteroidota bacterium]